MAFTVAGIVLYFGQRSQSGDFFERKAELPSDDVAAGRAIAEGALIDLHALMHEQSVSINTAAAGGNAQLMTLA